MVSASEGPSVAASVGCAEGAGPLAVAEVHVKQLEDLEDYYFGEDKGTRMAKLSTAVAECIERVLASPDSGIRLQELRPRALLLRGRAKSFLPGQEREAEELLSRAIKLDPQLLEAWNGLGEVYWRLHDVVQAKQCFEQALELCGANSVSLRNLSMALRALDTGDQATRVRNFAKALAKAKEAVAIDPNDPLNWETLGNAYVGDFFVSARRPDEISRALIAYAKAEAGYDRLGKGNPTLHFNRGVAAKYMEDYTLALRSFQRAHEMGAEAAAQEGRAVLELVQRLTGLVERKHDLKAKRLRELTADLEVPACRTLQQLQKGENSDVPLVAKVVSVVDRRDEVPAMITCCDASGAFFVLSVYNAELRRLAEAITPMKSVLRVQRPKFHQISVASPTGKEWSYPCAAASHPAEVALGSGGTLAAVAVQSTVFSTNPDLVTPGNAKPAVHQEPAQTQGEPREPTFAEHLQRMHLAAKEAGLTGQGRGAVIAALLPALKSLVKTELGEEASDRLGRVEAMFARMARKEVHEEDDEQAGRRYAPGYVEGLSPNLPFHDDTSLPWCNELKSHWKEIRDELRSRLNDAGTWMPGAYAASNKAYAPDWKISGVLVAEKWQDTWSTTQGIIKRLQGVTPFEAFFARMPPHSTIAAHSDNLNYIVTSHLGLDLEEGMCSIRVGNDERDWAEGEMLVFDTTYIHSTWNDSSRSRYVLVLRFWHPGLAAEERRAISLSQALLAETPDPERLASGAHGPSMSMTDA